MDKHIIDLLIDKSYITTIGVDHTKYETIEDLINQGVITMPGAYERIDALLNSTNIQKEEKPIIEIMIDDKLILSEPVTELNMIDETPESEPVIDETPESEPVIDETPESEPVIDETPEEIVTITEDESTKEAVMTEAADETIKTVKKSKKTKKSE